MVPVWAIAIFLGMGSLHLAAVALLIWQAFRAHAYDPMGHDARIGRTEVKANAAADHQAHVDRSLLEVERKLLEHIDESVALHARILSHMTGLERQVDTEAKERREVSYRLDQIQNGQANMAQRFGGFEVAVQRVIDLADEAGV